MYNQQPTATQMFIPPQVSTDFVICTGVYIKKNMYEISKNRR